VPGASTLDPVDKSLFDGAEHPNAVPQNVQIEERADLTVSGNVLGLLLVW